MIEQKEQVSYLCNQCNDFGYILIEENGRQCYKECSCSLLQQAKNRKALSGLGDALETKTLDNFETTNEFQKIIKLNAIDYLREFSNGNRYSFAMLGQSGIGKTHILSAVSKQLIDNGINVRYYIADEIIKTLQASKFDEENYAKEFNKIVSAEVLYIDDLFKSSITNFYKEENVKIDDLKEIFQVINYRYNKRLPILLSSEIHFERFTDIDQAIIGRINEMCNYKHIVSVKPDINKNYRLNKRSI